MRQSRPPLARMQHIDRELRNHNYPNCSRIALYFDVSSKSIQRDIDFMRDMLHAPIEYDPGKKGYFYKNSWKFDPSLFLNRQELEALAATTRVLAQYQGTPYYEEVCRAIEKIMQYLPVSCSGKGLFEIYSFDNPVPVCHIDQEKFALLEEAVSNMRKVSMTYNSSSRQVVNERIVHPYRLHYDQSSGIWYLIGYCEYRKACRTFAISRILTLVLTEEHFTIPESFSIGEYLAKAFQQTVGPATYEITIRFSSYQAQWIRERRWHSTQKIQEHEDGSLILSLSVGALDAVKRWIMQYGSQAEVLGPEELRDMVKMEVKEMGEVYGRG
ncbi:MAG: WYL domain-containing transcriptional regulator [Chlorobiaceae bacterium]|nr:WYL domain-containing transcriptional regulator [Chlorobiaceae bacterium]